ncbi:hypothetical protein KM295_10460 [Natronomonas sp. F2-12]|jgi:hypothetical protein|uniref:Uncharacterized protein n=1 Tax=Natronomonas aquatica TaxID=2841590 RepID=A0A9R1D7P3_9EURY|nr:hypothetical protein [Natronomonas aquatica]MCQ4333895.1 hypothetical protein [Natronomonas aquatica]
MTSKKPSITSKAALSAELQALLVRAYDNGIDVRGGFECRNGAEYPDWDVVVTEITKNERAD